MNTAVPGPGITPPALEKGDLIAFISPSGRLNHIFPQRIQQAKDFFASRGYRTLEIFTRDLTAKNNNININAPTALAHRVGELHAAFADPDVKAIICTIGGVSANELLPYIDYALVRANPKIFVGYSDITLLHHALYVKAGLRTFYGPAVIPQFGEVPAPLEFTSDHFFGTLTKNRQGADASEDQRTPVPRSTLYVPTWLDWSSEESNRRANYLQPSPRWKWLRGGRAKGVLYGGCLPSLVQLTGTPYLPAAPDFYAGKVLLLETPEGMGGPNTSFAPEAARAALYDLRNAGVLGPHLAGLVLGRCFMYDEAMTARFESDVLDVCSWFAGGDGTGIMAPGQTEDAEAIAGFPILANVDVGHVDPILTLPLGALVSLDSERDEFMLEESVVC